MKIRQKAEGRMKNVELHEPNKPLSRAKRQNLTDLRADG